MNTEYNRFSDKVKKDLDERDEKEKTQKKADDDLNVKKKTLEGEIKKMAKELREKGMITEDEKTKYEVTFDELKANLEREA